jgi:alkylhydroperoxidase family enzyme
VRYTIQMITPQISNEHSQLKKYFSKKQIIDIVSMIALFGFLNRWNDTLNTDLEPLFSES